MEPMPGAVYLGGGGSGQDEALLWTEMLDGCRRLLYWPFALEGSILAAAEVWLRSQLVTLDAAVDVQVWTTLQDKNPADLDDFDLLFVGGGNTFLLLHHLRVHGFVAPVRRWIHEGGRYYGGSAGAILAADSITVAGYFDCNDVGLDALAGLGLLPGVTLLPHYTTSQQDLAHTISRDLDRPVIAVPEAAGLVVAQGQIRAVGPRAVWTMTSRTATEHPPGSVLRINVNAGPATR